MEPNISFCGAHETFSEFPAAFREAHETFAEFPATLYNTYETFPEFPAPFRNTYKAPEGSVNAGRFIKITR